MSSFSRPVGSAGPIGLSDGAGWVVAVMPVADRFAIVLRRTLPLLPRHMRDEFAALLTPASLIVIASTLALWAGSHYFGVGFVVDALLLVGGFVFLGWQVFTAAADFSTSIAITASARTDADLNRAAEHLAKFVSVVGLAAFAALVMKGAKNTGARGGVGQVAARALGGIAPRHRRIFTQVAQETNRIIGVRFTNPKSTPWIERGFPAKPFDIKIKTSKETGIVTALDEAEVRIAREKGFFVVDGDGVARNLNQQELRFSSRPEWPVQPGQVIHPQQAKPLVGDYDLAAVINPNAKGRNLVLAARDGRVLDDWTNPDTRRIAEMLNSRMDQPRVLHGAHDGRFDIPDNAVFFLPDGTTIHLQTAEEVSAFYKAMGRQPITGAHPTRH